MLPPTAGMNAGARHIFGTNSAVQIFATLTGTPHGTRSTVPAGPVETVVEITFM